MEDTLRTFAGDCTITYDGTESITQRGAVLVLLKPDDTILVHDANGYQPAAWLTRADSVTVTTTDTGFSIHAHKDEASLSIESHATAGLTTLPISPAGPPLGDCPDCTATLVRTAGTIICTGCHTQYPIPRDATILETNCSDCDLPQMRVERGARFEVCIDDACDPLSTRVANQFDAAWPCPDCDDPLEITSDRGLQASCTSCQSTVAIPRGTITGECPCGLPLFASQDATRCFDPDCAAGIETAS